MSETNRVMTFIDNSNVYGSIRDLYRVDKSWVKSYDPLELSKKLAGDRDLVGVNFYCAPPPPYLQQDGEESEQKYWYQMDYYESIKKLPLVTFKLGYLTGPRDNLSEKNVDTQIVADMIVQANQNKYDTAILCSNDGDYSSAIQAVKEMGKRVEVMYFKGMCSYSLIRECDVQRRARMSHFIKIKKK